MSEEVLIFQLTSMLETFATQVKSVSGRLSEKDVEYIETYFLADPKLDINMKGQGWSLLHIAVKGQSPTLVREILKRKGVDVNIQTTSGRTPLMCAQDPEMAKILLKAGANPAHKVKVADGPEETASEFLLKSCKTDKAREAFEEIFKPSLSALKKQKKQVQVMDKKSPISKPIDISELPKFKVCQQTKTSNSSYDPKGEVPLITTVQLSQKLKENNNFTVLLEDDPEKGSQRTGVKMGQLYLEYQPIFGGTFSLDISFINLNKQMKHCLGMKTLVSSSSINFGDLFSFDLNIFYRSDFRIFPETHENLLGIVKKLNNFFLQASHGTLKNSLFLEGEITKFKALATPIKTIRFRDKPEKEMQADLNAQIKKKIGHARKIMSGEEKGTKIEDVWKSIERLIKEGADKNVEEDGVSVMQIAVLAGDSIAGKYVENLLLNDSSMSNELLFLARDLSMVKKLLEKSADLSHKNKLSQGKTAYEVLKERFLKIEQLIEFLEICLKHELESSIQTNYFKENISKISDIITDCVEKELDVTKIRNSQGYSVLHLAIKQRNIDLVRGILRLKKEGLNEEVKGVSSPLLLAVKNDNAELVKILLEAGANPNGGKPKDTLLFHTMDSEIIRLLLEAGADTNCKDRYGRTPYDQCLRIRRWSERSKIASAFLEHELKKKPLDQALISKYEKDKNTFTAALKKEEIRKEEKLLDLDKYKKYVIKGQPLKEPHFKNAELIEEEKIKSEKVFEDANFFVLLKDKKRRHEEFGVKMGGFYFKYGAGRKGVFYLNVSIISKNPKNELMPLLDIEEKGQFSKVNLNDILPFSLIADEPITVIGGFFTKGTPEQQAALEASMDSLRKCFHDNNTKGAPECVANFQKAISNLGAQSSVEAKSEVQGGEAKGKEETKKETVKVVVQPIVTPATVVAPTPVTPTAVVVPKSTPTPVSPPKISGTTTELKQKLSGSFPIPPLTPQELKIKSEIKSTPKVFPIKEGELSDIQQMELLTTNSHEIIPGLYLGDYEAYKKVSKGDSKEINMVVKVTAQPHDKVNAKAYFAPVPTGVSHIDIGHDLPDDASGWDELSKRLPQAFAAIDKALNAREKVLVHCTQGVSRSAAVAIAYLVYKFGVTVDEADNFVKSKRRQVNTKFLEQIKKYFGQDTQKTSQLVQEPRSESKSLQPKPAERVQRPFEEKPFDKPRKEKSWANTPGWLQGIAIVTALILGLGVAIYHLYWHFQLKNNGVGKNQVAPNPSEKSSLTGNFTERREAFPLVPPPKNSGQPGQANTNTSTHKSK